MPLSLHQLTALDASPRDLIDIAHRLGVASVCLFTHIPEAGRGHYPPVGIDDALELRTLVGEGRKIDPALLGDNDVPIKQIVKGEP